MHRSSGNHVVKIQPLPYPGNSFFSTSHHPSSLRTFESDTTTQSIFFLHSTGFFDRANESLASGVVDQTTCLAFLYFFVSLSEGFGGATLW